MEMEAASVATLAVACVALAGSFGNFLVIASKMSTIPERVKSLEVIVSSAGMISIPIRISALSDRVSQVEMKGGEMAKDIQDLKVTQAMWEATAG